MASNVPAYTYCEIADMVNVMSQAGIDLRTDDNPPSTFGNAAFEAVSRLNFYLFKAYDPALLQQSYWCTFNSARIAVYILCGRRGNPKPASIAADYKEILENLKLIYQGAMQLPDVAPRRGNTPVMSNLFVKLAPQPHVRVHMRTSTTTGGSPTAYPRIIDLSNWTDLWSNWPMS